MPISFTQRQFVFSLVIAIILAGALGYYLGRKNLFVSQNQEAAADTMADLSNAVIPSENTLAVPDQAAGDAVHIASAKLKDSAWVAIHEDKNGKPGNILGALLLPAGLSEDATVELLRPTVAGVYYAMLHQNNGDRQFDYDTDTPLTANGSPVMQRFVVGGNAE